MKRIFTVFFVVAALGCQPETPSSGQPAFDPNQPEPKCPTLPRDLGISIEGEQGPDFWTCTATADATKKPKFQIYVGNFPLQAA